jgi:hypothetical protein
MSNYNFRDLEMYRDVVRLIFSPDKGEAMSITIRRANAKEMAERLTKAFAEAD